MEYRACDFDIMQVDYSQILDTSVNTSLEILKNSPGGALTFVKEESTSKMEIFHRLVPAMCQVV